MATSSKEILPPPTTMATSSKEILPPPLDATGVQPPLFDGTTRLYTCSTCPFAQRVWITRNYKGLRDKIKLVPLNLQDIPAWYKDVYPPNKVPSLEHNGKFTGESLDLIKYVDSNFEGRSLFPDDPEKEEFGKELFSHTDTFVRTVFPSFKGDPAKEIGPAFDYLEERLGKFDGPFFLGQFSLVDIAYIPFVERFQIFLSEVFKIDITTGRRNLAVWIEKLNEIHACTQTKTDSKELNKVIGKIIGDINFEGSSLFPDDPKRRKFVEELFSYTSTFITTVFPSSEGDPEKQIGPAFDYLEERLGKVDGPFFLGQFSLVDIAYIPFVERFQIFLSEVFEIDITTGRRNLAAWIEELNKIDAYTQTKPDPKELNKDPEKKKFVKQLFSDVDELIRKLCSFQGNSAEETS